MQETRRVALNSPFVRRNIAVLCFYIFCLFLPVSKYLEFTGLATDQTYIVQILRLIGSLVLLLGVLSFVLIASKVLKTPDRMGIIDRQAIVGYTLGFIAVTFQIIAIVFGQKAAESLMASPNEIYWMYWPLFSYVPMIGITISAGVLMLLSILFIHYGFNLRTSPMVSKISKVTAFSIVIVLGIILPLLGLHGYIEGNYLFGRVSSIPPATETFNLFEQKMAYGLPNLIYLDGVVTGDPLFIILGVAGLFYLVLISLATISILLGLSLQETNKASQTKTSVLFSIGRYSALISVVSIWFVYTSLFLFIQWPITYDLFLDIRGLWFGFLILVCIYIATSKKQTSSEELEKGSLISRPSGFTHPFRHPIWIVSIIVLLLNTSIVINGISSSYLYVQPTIEVEDNIQNCLQKYEQKYVQSVLNPSYGFTPTDGYPMYLFVLGEMYYWMYETTGEIRFRNQLLSVANISLSIMNDDWTWNMGWRERISNLYNSLAANLFLYCFDMTQSQIFLDYANNSLQALLDEGVVTFSGTNDDKFLAFTVIAEYLSKVEDPDADLWEFGSKLYNFSIAQYDVESHIWYYTEEDMTSETFDEHDAFYELFNIYNYLKYRIAVGDIFPEFNATLYEHLPDMMETAISYMNENGTYYYKPQTDDYTESAADALVTIELFDLVYNTNHSIQKERSKQTILNRQLSNGAFLRTGRLIDGYSLWYTDNIGKSIAQWLYIVSS